MSETPGTLQKLKQSCPQCKREVDGFLIPDGRFICPKCAPPAVYARWEREWAPIAKELEKAAKEREKKESERAKRVSSVQPATAAAADEPPREHARHGGTVTLPRRAPTATSRATAGFQVGMLCAIGALVACLGYAWFCMAKMESDLADLTKKQTQFETETTAKLTQLTTETHDLLVKLNDLAIKIAPKPDATATTPPLIAPRPAITSGTVR